MRLPWKKLCSIKGSPWCRRISWCTCNSLTSKIRHNPDKGFMWLDHCRHLKYWNLRKMYEKAWHSYLCYWINKQGDFKSQKSGGGSCKTIGMMLNCNWSNPMMSSAFMLLTLRWCTLTWPELQPWKNYYHRNWYESVEFMVQFAGNHTKSVLVARIKVWVVGSSITFCALLVDYYLNLAGV